MELYESQLCCWQIDMRNFRVGGVKRFRCCLLGKVATASREPASGKNPAESLGRDLGTVSVVSIGSLQASQEQAEPVFGNAEFSGLAETLPEAPA